MKGAFKKVINYAILALIIIPCALFLAACGDKDNGDNGNNGGDNNQQQSTIAGNYVLDDISCDWAEEVTAEQKAAMLAGDPETTEDDMTEADFFAFMKNMIAAEMIPVNYALSLEFSSVGDRCFFINERIYIGFVTDGTCYDKIYNEDAGRSEFTIGDTTYYNGSSERFALAETNAYQVVDNQFTIGADTYEICTASEGYDSGYITADNGTTKIALTINASSLIEFTISETVYTIDYRERILDTEDDSFVAAIMNNEYGTFIIDDVTYSQIDNYVVSKSPYEANHSTITIGDTEYLIDLLNGVILDEDEETVATITNGQFTLGEKTYSIISRTDNEAYFSYYSYNKDSGLVTVYEDKAKTIVSTNGPTSFEISGDTALWIMNGADMDDSVSMLVVTFSFKKA